MSGLYFLLTWELAELGELEKVSEFMFSSPHFIWKFDVPGRSLFFLCVCVFCVVPITLKTLLSIEKTSCFS